MYHLGDTASKRRARFEQDVRSNRARDRRIAQYIERRTQAIDAKRARARNLLEWAENPELDTDDRVFDARREDGR